jgi:uncharacterized protein YxjI
MRFPLSVSFKKLALAPQIFIRDADGQLQLYVRQKLMKLKEAVSIFGDEAQQNLLYTVQADRVIDIRARYTMRDAAGTEIGHLQGMGMRSLWKLHYEIGRNGSTVFSVREDNAWVKVVDRLVGEIPVIGLFTGYFLNPKYNVTRPDGSLALRLVKQPAFLQGLFTIEKVADLTPEEEGMAVLGLLMMLLLERRRG